MFIRIPFADVEVQHRGVYSYRRGLRVARSTRLGNARAFRGGTGSSTYPRLFYVVTNDKRQRSIRGALAAKMYSQ